MRKSLLLLSLGVLTEAAVTTAQCKGRGAWTREPHGRGDGGEHAADADESRNRIGAFCTRIFSARPLDHGLADIAQSSSVDGPHFQMQRLRAGVHDFLALVLSARGAMAAC